MTSIEAPTETLVDAEWLEAHLHDPRLRLVEVDVDSRAYDDKHIEGAVLWNIYRDLKTPGFQPVDAAAIEGLIRRSGIEPDSTVVFYGYAPAMGFWLMKLFNHIDVRILDGGRQRWQGEGRPWATQAVTPCPGDYGLPAPADRLRCDQSRVLAAVHHATATIVDVRSEAEYRGDCFWPSGGMQEGGRAGRIPAAVNV
ncbi:MAG: sulfurtransferase, partial [Acidimicrobiia bacterium]|nr:sulfurtransferase [Acidimicrobiia bacterium]